MAKVLQSKRVIQSKDTKLFFKSDGQWTDQLDDAVHFKSLADVVSVCEEHALKGVELVMKFTESQYDTRFNFAL